MRKLLSATLAVMSVAVLATASAHAQSETSETTKCTPAQFGERIDETGEHLRSVSRKSEPALRRKFQRLARSRGWPAGEAEERGYELIQDANIATFDRSARSLLIELDKIGAVDAETATCKKLERLEAVTFELRAITDAKVKYVHQRLDAALSSNPEQPTKPSSNTTTPKTSASNPPPAASSKQQAGNAPATKKSATPPPRSTATANWQTSTTPNLAANERAPTQPRDALPPPINLPAGRTYSTDEISHAGRGLFGTISANLASVIRYAFATYGKPNGYIVGTEGGGAFLAGLSYGKGKLHTKTGAPIDVYWQGPTVGYDLGITGSRVMFLVYNLEDIDDLYSRFGGVGGSAYVVGGVGLTFHQRGNIILAPIRTGLGLRIGANIGYLKFTPERSLNPF